MTTSREDREISEPTGEVTVEDGEPRIDKSPGATFGVVSLAYFAIFAAVVFIIAAVLKMI